MRKVSIVATRVLVAASCLFALAVAAIPASGQAADPRPDPRAEGASGTERVQALLLRVKQEQAAITSLTAEFVQRKESDLLLEQRESRGQFAFERPDRVLWEYESPDPMHVLVDGGTMLTWYENLGRAEQVEVGRYSDRILEYLGATNSLDLLRQYFDVSVTFPSAPDAPYRLELAPNSKRVAKRLAGMTVWLDPERYVPVRLLYLEADGDRTEYEFHHLEVNPEIPPSRFDLDLPPGVDVRHVTLDGD